MAFRWTRSAFTREGTVRAHTSVVVIWSRRNIRSDECVFTFSSACNVREDKNKIDQSSVWYHRRAIPSLASLMQSNRQAGHPDLVIPYQNKWPQIQTCWRLAARSFAASAYSYSSITFALARKVDCSQNATRKRSRAESIADCTTHPEPEANFVAARRYLSFTVPGKNMW